MPSSRSPLRVLQVIGGLELGGAETLLYRLATHDIAGIAQDVVCLGPRGWYSDLLEQRGIAVRHLGMRSLPTTVGALGALRRHLRERQPDVIQSWMYVANALSGLLAPRTARVVWGIHNSSLDHVGLVSRICAQGGGAAARRLASFVINCSQRSAELHAPLGYAAAPNRVIHNGYDPEAFAPDEDARAATRAALGLDDNVFAIGSIARWHPQKDVPTLLRAVRMATDAGVPLRCLLIGRGLGADNLQLNAEVRRNGCDALVMPLGPRSDVQELARALDLHVLASSGGEAFPNVVAETMLSSTPNAVTNVGDSALMVGDTGWVVPPRDPERLAAAITAAWTESTSQPQHWQDRRAAARSRMAENFTFEAMAEAYAEVWREVAARSSEPMIP